MKTEALFNVNYCMLQTYWEYKVQESTKDLKYTEKGIEVWIHTPFKSFPFAWHVCCTVLVCGQVFQLNDCGKYKCMTNRYGDNSLISLAFFVGFFVVVF